MIVAEYENTVEDVHEAEDAHFRSSTGFLGLVTRPSQPVWQYVPARAKATFWTTSRGIIGWMIFVALATMLFTMLGEGRSNTTSPATAPVSPLPLIPWALIFFGMWFVIYMVIRRTVRRTWRNHPSPQLIHRLQASEAGVTIDDGETHNEMTWRAIKRAVETPNLLLLYTSQYTFWIVPKRALAVAAADEFRQLVRSQVQPPSTAFPVLPVK